MHIWHPKWILGEQESFFMHQESPAISVRAMEWFLCQLPEPPYEGLLHKLIMYRETDLAFDLHHEQGTYKVAMDYTVLSIKSFGHEFWRSFRNTSYRICLWDSFGFHWKLIPSVWKVSSYMYGRIYHFVDLSNGRSRSYLEEYTASLTRSATFSFEQSCLSFI